jgi:hypothetical protein
VSQFVWFFRLIRVEEVSRGGCMPTGVLGPPKEQGFWK